jgi:hypothetical protein
VFNGADAAFAAIPSPGTRVPLDAGGEDGGVACGVGGEKGAKKMRLWCVAEQGAEADLVGWCLAMENCSSA